MARFRSDRKTAKHSPVEVGDVVHVEGCHENYRPRVVKINGLKAVVETPAVLSRKEWLKSKLWLPDEWKVANKGRKR